MFRKLLEREIPFYDRTGPGEIGSYLSQARVPSTLHTGPAWHQNCGVHLYVNNKTHTNAPTHRTCPA